MGEQKEADIMNSFEGWVPTLGDKVVAAKQVALPHLDKPSDAFEIMRKHDAIADCAVITNDLEFIGVEIKSDSDSLSRLASQIPAYTKVFDRMYLITGERLHDRSADAVPAHWGLACCKGADITVTRRAGLNREHSLHHMVAMLWRESAISILASRGLARGWRSAGRRQLHHRLINFVNHNALVPLALRQITVQWREGGKLLTAPELKAAA